MSEGEQRFEAVASCSAAPPRRSSQIGCGTSCRKEDRAAVVQSKENAYWEHQRRTEGDRGQQLMRTELQGRMLHCCTCAGGQSVEATAGVPQACLYVFTSFLGYRSFSASSSLQEVVGTRGPVVGPESKGSQSASAACSSSPSCMHAGQCPSACASAAASNSNQFTALVCTASMRFQSFALTRSPCPSRYHQRWSGRA